jgi:hypothetical protein
MGMLTVACTACKSTVTIPDALIGKDIHCPSCNNAFPVKPPSPDQDDLALQPSTTAQDAGGPADPTAIEKCPYCGAAWKKGRVDCTKCRYNAITQRRMKELGKPKSRFSLDVHTIFIYAVIIGVLVGIYWLYNNFDRLRREGRQMYDNAARSAPTETDDAAMTRKDAAQAQKVKD